MSAQCGPEFVNKFCGCLPDPVSPGSTICGYVNRQNGLVYPCDVGCCDPGCQNPGQQPPRSVELRKSKGTTLPPGFNTNLAQNSEPTPIPGATDLATPTNSYGSQQGPPDYKVWHIFLLMFVLLGVMVMALFVA